jgi:hypothetical protein
MLYRENRGCLLWLNDQAVLILGKRLPLIGQKLSQAVYGMAHDPLQKIVEVLPGIYVAGCC